MRCVSLALSPMMVLAAYAQPVGKAQQPAAQDLYEQATQAMLDRDFASPRIEYLLLDLRSRQTIAMRWAHPERAVPVGSLLKPFVALAYRQVQASSTQPGSLMRHEFPVIRCHGKSDGCWRAGGHGPLGLEQAVAESCNAYFLSLAREIATSGREHNGNGAAGMEALHNTAISYGLPAPPTPHAHTEQAWPRSLIGATPEWRIAPQALGLAYAALASQSGDATVDRLLAGMRLAASSQGTAAKLGQHPGGVLAKTGTAPCVLEHEPCLASGDGLIVVLAPAEHPSLLLLVRRRGTTGAQAAEVAGRMLTRIEDGHGK